MTCSPTLQEHARCTPINTHGICRTLHTCPCGVRQNHCTLPVSNFKPPLMPEAVGVAPRQTIVAGTVIWLGFSLARLQAKAYGLDQDFQPDKIHVDAAW